MEAPRIAARTRAPGAYDREVFATILGPLPPIDGLPPDAPEADRIAALVALQAEAGIGLLTDGGAPSAGEDPVARWRAVAAVAGEHPVKASLAGPGAFAGSDRAATDAALERLVDEVRALDLAGCPFVELVEPVLPGDPAGIERLVAAHRRLTDALGPLATHLGLALGPGAERLGDALFATAYRSFAFDLIAGPDDWRIAVRVPGDRGVICGAIDPGSPGPGDLESAIWAARYAASTGGRGLERVGLAVAPGLDRLAGRLAPAELAATVRRKLRTVGEVVRLAGASRTELAELADPRALGPA